MLFSQYQYKDENGRILALKKVSSKDSKIYFKKALKHAARFI